MSISVDHISKRELLAYRADIKGAIFRQIRQVLARLKETAGFTQKDLAAKIGVDEGQLSRTLRGENDPQLETLSDLARGLDCRIEVRLVPIIQPAALDIRAVTADDHKGIDPGPSAGSAPVNDNKPRIEILAS